MLAAGLSVLIVTFFGILNTVSNVFQISNAITQLNNFVTSVNTYIPIAKEYLGYVYYFIPKNALQPLVIVSLAIGMFRLFCSIFHLGKAVS